MSDRIFVLVQKGIMPKKKVIAARNLGVLKDWTKFTIQNNENKKRKTSFTANFRKRVVFVLNCYIY